jgi:hypothetical protein
VNGTKVTNGSDLYRILDQCKVGDTVSFCFSCWLLHMFTPTQRKRFDILDGC